MQQLKVQDILLLVHDSFMILYGEHTFARRQDFQQDLDKNKINDSSEFTLFLITSLYKYINVYEHRQK